MPLKRKCDHDASECAGTARNSSASNRDRLVGHHLGPHLSQSALAYSLQYIRDNGLASASSRATQLRARQSTVEDMRTPYGRIVVPVELPVVIDGTSQTETVFLIHPLAILWRTVHDCLPFAELVSVALNSHACDQQHPWRMVLYMDEVTPSTDMSGGVDGREMQCIYWTFVEFGDRVYSEDMWMVLGAVRSDLVNRKLPGGMSRLLAMAMRMFFSPDSHDASKSGVTLAIKQASGEHKNAKLFMVHHATIADFKALCQILGANSQSGTKPCPECRDIIDPFKSKDAELIGPGLVPFTSTEPNTWRKHDDASVLRIVAKLRDAVGGRKKELATIHGYKYCQYNIMNDPHLKYRPITTLLYDWQHVWCVGGVFDRSMTAVIQSLNGLVDCGDFHTFFKPWVWPLQFPSASAIFENGRFLADASLTLSCVPVMIRFLRDVVRPSANAAQSLAITSHILACECVMLLNSRSCTPDELEEATTKFANAHVAAHGFEHWVFKFHQSLDLANQYRRFLRNSDIVAKLPNCWCLERKHKIVKKHTRDHRNTKGIERALAENIVIDHMHHWREEFLLVGFKNPHQPNASTLKTLMELYPHAAQIQVSYMYLSQNGQQFHKGDFVFTTQGDGQIWYHFQTNSTDLLTVFEPYELIHSDRKRKIAKYRVRGEPLVVPVSALRRTAIYKRDGDQVTVLVT